MSELLSVPPFGLLAENAAVHDTLPPDTPRRSGVAHLGGHNPDSLSVVLAGDRRISDFRF